MAAVQASLLVNSFYSRVFFTAEISVYVDFLRQCKSLKVTLGAELDLSMVCLDCEELTRYRSGRDPTGMRPSWVCDFMRH